MIVTVTMNPSVDIAYTLPHLNLDQVNRCNQVSKTAGGKGLNVTRVIHQMNQDVVSTGLLGGALGDFIRESLTKDGIKHNFSDIDGQTRNCLAILHDNGAQTEILEAGPTITAAELKRFEQVMANLLPESDVMTLSGSLPKGIPTNYYVRLLELMSKDSIKVVLDTSGQSLIEVLQSSVKPYAIKPNLDELSDLTNQILTADETALKQALTADIFEGIPLIVVSLGSDGAFVKYTDRFYRVTIPKITVVNPVGSGDSTVAGIAIGLQKKESIEKVIKRAMALGMSNATHQATGYIDQDSYQEFEKQILVQEIK
ncbi:tagatose-6-phosphate kinase [Vagococcus penaei]|uniref:Tagatose-6-phosphate kinase n=1 Tax=Vagococcus penaei TaxID=633807 RepID=A0A1Q2D4V6_9ENTE|nr:hexose kinase [Vagococcus penaei]AQP53404.1 tagatose-6-phosphate kinase [Vagococcus penaei]RST98630.1 tagatose-6-phosphate kinase [Vagococcus penaei]